MKEHPSNLVNIANTTSHLAVIVFFILGIPLIILQLAGFSFFTVPPVIDRIAGTLAYIPLAGFSGFCGLLISFAILHLLYRWITGAASAPGFTFSSLAVLLWWCWGAVLSWGMFATLTKQLLDLWTM